MRELLIALCGIVERIVRQLNKSSGLSTASTAAKADFKPLQTLVNCMFKNSLINHRKNIQEFDESVSDVTAVKVSSHMLMRHTQLHLVEQLTREHQVHAALEKLHEEEKTFPLRDSPESGAAHARVHPAERAYRLAVTDLFVEKAQTFLEERAESYRGSGRRARWIASLIVIGGAFLAIYQMFHLADKFAHSWLELISLFTRAFTAYGMIVLAAVGFWRYSKSMLDQAERLFERRHALRQGRLFVHLKDGGLNIDEMERAFKWTESQENAFANINTEASAPWGGVMKEFAKSFPEVVKAGLQNLNKGKADEK